MMAVSASRTASIGRLLTVIRRTVIRRTVIRRTVILVTVILTLPPLSAAAQTTPNFSVSVTEASELVEEVGTTRRITRADIEARNARTLDEALRLVPGIYIRTGGDGTPRVDVRGFRSRHVLLLINGVPANSTADGQFDPARISMDAVREIKISYGSSSVLYGDNALAAVIEITTIDANPDSSANVSAGTPDQWGLGGRYSRTAGKWSLTTTGTTHTTDGFRLPGSFTPTTLEDGDRRQNSDRDRHDLRGALGYVISPKVSIGSEWSAGTGSYGIPAGTIDDPADIFAQTPRFERVEDYRSVSGQFSIVAAPSRRVNLRAWVFRNLQREDRSRYDDNTYSSMDDPEVQGTFRSREDNLITGGSALARLDLERFGWLRVAINQRREAFESSGVIRDVAVGGAAGGGGGGGGGAGGGRPGGNRPAMFDVREFAIDRHVDVYSTGAEWQIRPATRLGVVLGTAVNVQQRPGAITDTEPTWLAGLSYGAADELRLHASATRKIRVPSIDQLFNTSSGNATLRSEHAYGVDAGADYRLGSASNVVVSAFATDARDFIERTSPDPFENHDRYRFRGVEVVIQTSQIPQLNLRGVYSFLDADDLTNGTLPLQTRPRHRGSLEWIWSPIVGSTVRGAAYRTGSQLYDSRGADPIQRRADGYTVVDVGITQTLARRFDVVFDVTSLFDRLYDQAYGLPREGRAAILMLRARLR
jgi:vitamin B12 transporter